MWIPSPLCPFNTVLEYTVEPLFIQSRAVSVSVVNSTVCTPAFLSSLKALTLLAARFTDEGVLRNYVPATTARL